MTETTTTAVRTVADLRRVLHPGVVLDVVEHRYLELAGERTVVRAQTKRASLTLPAAHPRAATTPTGSWFDFPRSSDLLANEDGTFTVLSEDGSLLLRARVLAG